MVLEKHCTLYILLLNIKKNWWIFHFLKNAGNGPLTWNHKSTRNDRCLKEITFMYLAYLFLFISNYFYFLNLYKTGTKIIPYQIKLLGTFFFLRFTPNGSIVRFHLHDLHWFLFSLPVSRKIYLDCIDSSPLISIHVAEGVFEL